MEQEWNENEREVNDELQQKVIYSHLRFLNCNGLKLNNSNPKGDLVYSFPELIGVLSFPQEQIFHPVALAPRGEGTLLFNLSNEYAFPSLREVPKEIRENFPMNMDLKNKYQISTGNFFSYQSKCIYDCPGLEGRGRFSEKLNLPNKIPHVTFSHYREGAKSHHLTYFIFPNRRSLENENQLFVNSSRYIVSKDLAEESLLLQRDDF